MWFGDFPAVGCKPLKTLSRRFVPTVPMRNKFSSRSAVSRWKHTTRLSRRFFSLNPHTPYRQADPLGQSACLTKGDRRRRLPQQRTRH
jgi:hypothetical protein